MGVIFQGVAARIAAVTGEDAVALSGKAKGGFQAHAAGGTGNEDDGRLFFLLEARFRGG